MNKTKPGVLTAVILGILWAGTATASKIEFKVSPSTLSFGRVHSGQASAVKTVTITNQSSSSVDISSIAPSGPYVVTADDCTPAVAAGAKCHVSVKFAPVSASNLKGSAETGTLSISSGLGPAAVRLTGTAFGAEGLFVANFFNDSVNVFPFGEFGNVSPIRIIGGAKTGLNYPYGLALDAKGTIYIANLHGGPDSLGSVTVYRAGSNGNAAPMLNIAGDKTGLNYPWGIAVDSKGKIYVANIGPCCEPSCGESITIYSPHANGNVAPIATIPADATTQLNAPYGMTFDSKGNLWVADYGGGPSGVGAITAYPAGASGEVAPIVNITGDRAGDSNAGLFGTAAVTFDSKGDIFATNGLGANVTVYSAGSNGNATPVATIGGGNTGFSVAEMNIMLDNAGNIYIANQQFGYDVSHPSAIDSWSNGGGFIEIFPPGSNGNVAYTNAIQGDNTYMNGPWGFAFGPIDR